MARPVHRHGEGLAGVLAALWVLLIAYASLYPFAGWRIPPGAGVLDLMHLQWRRWIPGFDPLSNLLGYLPLGLLVALASLGRHGSRRRALVRAALAGALLSYSLEVVQQFVPRRVPSALDWAMNVAGTLAGAGLALLTDALGWTRRWRWMHRRWLERGGRSAPALLLLWPVGLLFPSPLPFGLGQVGGRLRDLADQVLQGVPGSEPLRDWLAATEVFEPASPAIEWSVAVLGLLAPCLLAYAASAPGWRRLGFAVGLPLTAAAAAMLSTLLAFGPEHAWAWQTPTVTAAMGLAVVLAATLMRIGPGLAAALALVALTGLVVLVHLAPADPYFAQNLQAWEQGEFIRFHGLAEWVGWLWPYAAMGWLLTRLRTAAAYNASS